MTKLLRALGLWHWCSHGKPSCHDGVDGSACTPSVPANMPTSVRVSGVHSLGNVQVGDASGIQSPLSFGGFGALTRHLHRLQNAIAEALEARPRDRMLLSLQVACQARPGCCAGHSSLIVIT